MSTDPTLKARPNAATFAGYAGLVVSALSVVGLVIGLILIQSLSGDLRGSVSVSRSALEAISRTIEAVDEVAVDTAASIDSASQGVERASETTENAVATLEGVASFLDEEIPETIESITASMPAAIQAANAVDRTLRALSVFGVDYDPEEGFGESLASVNEALESLPTELRAQSESIRELVTSSRGLVDDTERIALSIQNLSESLEGFTQLTATYEETIAEAQTTIEETDNSIDSSLWMMRLLLIAASIAGVVTGLVLFVLGRDVAALHGELASHTDPATSTTEKSSLG